MINQKVLDMLKRYAQEEMPADEPDFSVDDYAGSNVDDAYALGEEAGQIQMARSILAELGISYLT